MNIENTDVDATRDAYDSPWKQLIEDCFEAFLSFFFPDIHAAVDWSHVPEFLDKEISAIGPDHDQGSKRVDKLVKVFLGDAGEVWLLIHIEVQVTRDGSFPRRMFIYYYRLVDKYGREVISLAILGDSNPDWRPSSFVTQRCGCSVAFTFPMVKLWDYRGQRDALEASDNPFALAVAAHLASLETKGNRTERLRWKKRLMRLLLAKGWQGDRVRGLFDFMDYVLALPQALDKQIEEELNKEMGGSDSMRYVNYFERKYTQIGEKKGRLDFLRMQLQDKFGDLPEWASSKLENADVASLEEWGRAALTKDTLEEVLAT